METETLTVAERTCKDCGGPLGVGREDRQYCSDACKTNFNNQRRREIQSGKTQQKQVGASYEPEQLSAPAYINRIQEILLKNRDILEGLCSEEKPGRIRLRDLIGKGFNTKFITSESEPTGLGKIYRFCFEFGYYEDKGYVIIVCRKREVI